MTTATARGENNVMSCQKHTHTHTHAAFNKSIGDFEITFNTWKRNNERNERKEIGLWAWPVWLCVMYCRLSLHKCSWLSQPRGTGMWICTTQWMMKADIFYVFWKLVFPLHAFSLSFLAIVSPLPKPISITFHLFHCRCRSSLWLVESIIVYA